MRSVLTDPALASWEDEGGPSVTDPHEQLASALDWSAFTARFFPRARRHDVGPLKAYEAYLNRHAA